MGYNLNAGRTIRTGLCLAFIAALGGSVKGCYNADDHDGLAINEFQRQVRKDHTPRLLTVTADGVTREGYLVNGAVIEMKDHNPTPSALIVARSPLGKCWFARLHVTEVNGHVPLWDQVFGADVTAIEYVNSDFRGSACLATETESLAPSPAPTAP